MEQLRRIWGTIGKQLGQLGPSQRLLIGSLLVIVLMTLFLVSQYAGARKMVELIPSAGADEQTRAQTYLMSVGLTAEMKEGKVVVPAERQYVALAQLTQAQMLPADKKLVFDNLIEKQNMFMPKGQLDQMYMTALTNELSKVISGFDGIEDARVFISNPVTTGLGAATRKPVAQVTVFTGRGRSGAGLDQKTVDALADVVAGAVAGLDLRNVAIIDGTSRRRYRATAPEDIGGQTYMEQVAAVEDRVREKIEDHLGRFISGVVVSVNAMVDASKRERIIDKALEKGQGSVSIPTSETNTTSNSSGGTKAGEPGLGSNVGLDINGGNGGPSNQTTSETTEVSSSVRIGSEVTKQVDPRGRPTKINVTVSVPRDYVLEILKSRAGEAPGGNGAGGGTGGGGPTDADVEKEWQTQQARLVGMIKPLIDTKDVPTTIAEAGEVVVTLMPVALGLTGEGGNTAGLGGSVGGGGGGSGMISKLLSGGVIKQALLGVLALVALGMTFVMVRRVGKPQALPTAEELVGIPPALQPDSDLVGEADESETAMTGIEVDSDALKTSKMLEEVQELVSKNPQTAATVFSRWLATEE